MRRAPAPEHVGEGPSGSPECTPIQTLTWPVHGRGNIVTGPLVSGILPWMVSTAGAWGPPAAVASTVVFTAHLMGLRTMSGLQ